MVLDRNLADPECSFCDGSGECPCVRDGVTTWVRCACCGCGISVEALRDLVLRDVAHTLRESGRRSMARLVEMARQGRLDLDGWADLRADAEGCRSQSRYGLDLVPRVLAEIQRAEVVTAAKLLAHELCGMGVGAWAAEVSEEIARRAA